MLLNCNCHFRQVNASFPWQFVLVVLLFGQVGAPRGFLFALLDEGPVENLRGFPSCHLSPITERHWNVVIRGRVEKGLLCYVQRAHN